VDAGFPKRSCSTKDLERDVDSTSNDRALVHDPEKHALGLDPTGGARFWEKIMHEPKILDLDAIRFDRIKV
jgi:hypothetical protein